MLPQWATHQLEELLDLLPFGVYRFDFNHTQARMTGVEVPASVLGYKDCDAPQPSRLRHGQSDAANVRATSFL